MGIISITSFAKIAGVAFVLAAQNSPKVIAEEPLQLATRQHLPPYVYENAHSGIEIDLVKAIFANTGLDIKFVQMPRVRMIQTFDQGEADGILTQNINVSEVGCATDWYLKHQNVGFTLAEDKVPLNSLSDLGSLSVLSFNGARKYLGKNFRDAISSNPLYHESSNQASHIELLYLRRFTVVVGDEWILRLAQRNRFDSTGDYKRLTVHYVMPPSLYSARFQDPQVCRRFNTSLAELRRSGEYDRIVFRYHQRIMIAASDY